MNRPGLAAFWKTFFTDLLIGTFKSLFLFGLTGFLLGMAGVYGLFELFLAGSDWPSWLQWLVLLFGLGWFGTLGIFHGAISSAVWTADRKLAEMTGGIHDLLDLLSHQVMQKVSRTNKTIPREEVEERFDRMGKKFLENLNLQWGFVRIVAGIVYSLVLKTLKFLFINDVLDELSKKSVTEITSSDIESAVRRVGVETAMSPIHDSFLLIHILNLVLICVGFGIPFAILYLIR